MFGRLTLFLIIACFAFDAAAQTADSFFTEGFKPLFQVNINAHQSTTFNKGFLMMNEPQKCGVNLPSNELPRGAIFCRFEDYLMDKTNVWIKIRVE